ncbi:MAG: NADH-quinone oxidoreductase subunit C [Actinobacteria bacterium]|nr:NADH-quinone oxidoreductase subunit C [Actinomycetota bacterium]
MNPLPSADPGPEDASAGSSPSPPAEEITDPALRAEVDNPAESNAPTGAEAGPGEGPAAAEAPPLPATGAPGELSSDQTPSQGQERGVASPDQGLVDVPGGDAGSPESAPGGATDAVVPATPVAPSPAQGGATVPEQPPPTSRALAGEGALVREAQAEQAEQAEQAASAHEPGSEPDPGELDEPRQDLVGRLRSALGDGLVDVHVVPEVEVWARVAVEHWHRAFEVCRDDLGLTYFDFLSAIDWLPSPYGRSEDPGADGDGDGDGEAAPTAEGSSGELEHGTTGGSTRFQLLARLVSPVSHLGLILKADVDDEEPRAPTVSDVYPGADWHERETWEMYGIDFTGHPHLVHLYLPGAFEGHPQRKDFPLLAREVKPWPGLVDVEAMPGEAEAASA